VEKRYRNYQPGVCKAIVALNHNAINYDLAGCLSNNKHSTDVELVNRVRASVLSIQTEVG